MRDPSQFDMPRKSLPQGLKAESFCRIRYGLKPVPTSPYLPSRTYTIEFFRSL
jgi:hypothetical protein